MSLGKTLNALCHLEAKQSTQVVAQPEIDRLCKQNNFYVRAGITDAVCSTTSGSNEEE